MPLKPEWGTDGGGGKSSVHSLLFSLLSWHGLLIFIIHVGHFLFYFLISILVSGHLYVKIESFLKSKKSYPNHAERYDDLLLIIHSVFLMINQCLLSAYLIIHSGKSFKASCCHGHG
ncbi:hypothetical protein OIU79_025685 [Salix purpurea]|uniref:Uncharacterized protein n=1 Tax=Salix purpurea TaxID=77065 RepID=A0A9Q1A7N8_SALPP|nr:hypothetical protein OIU79_025685 [Salix purpurea]